jgi:hypothetical protein
MKFQNAILCIILALSSMLSFNNLTGQNIPAKYRKTVCFLSTNSVSGEKQDLGTGFFIGVLDSPLLFTYVVTDKHVLTEGNNNQPFNFLKISYNKINQSRDSIQMQLYGSGSKKNLFYHTDPSVDLVVIPVPLRFIIDSSDINLSFESELFKSFKDFDTSYVKPGTNLFYTGMFAPYLGYNKNYPITRFGKVALISDEKIPFEKNEPKATLFLAETTTFGGNSGSPVFAYGSEYKINSHDPSDPINTKEQNNIPIYLVGVVKGYFQENNSISFVPTSIMKPTYSNNIGIAAIIPSFLLFEILESPELNAFRKRYK